MNAITSAADLKAAYLATYHGHSVTPSDIVDTMKARINTRYAREMLATLTDAGLVTKTEDEDGSDVWQTVPTRDEMDEDEAHAKFDEWLDAVAEDAEKDEPVEEGAQVTGSCYCGCGQSLTGKSFYKPGHDARHAGVVGRAAAEEILNAGRLSLTPEDDDAFADLPSDALVRKSKGIAANVLAREATKRANKAKREADKAEKAAHPEVGSSSPRRSADKPKGQPKLGIIKIGKNEHVATMFPDGKVTYLKGNEEKVASKTASSTFTEE